MLGGVYHRKAHSNEIAEFYKMLNKLIMKKFPNSFNNKKQFLDWYLKLEKEYQNQVYWGGFTV